MGFGAVCAGPALRHVLAFKKSAWSCAQETTICRGFQLKCLFSAFVCNAFLSKTAKCLSQLTWSIRRVSEILSPKRVNTPTPLQKTHHFLKLLEALMNSESGDSPSSQHPTCPCSHTYTLSQQPRLMPSGVGQQAPLMFKDTHAGNLWT